MSFTCLDVDDLCEQMIRFKDKEILQIAETALGYLYEAGWTVEIDGVEMMKPEVSCRKCETLEY